MQTASAAIESVDLSMTGNLLWKGMKTSSRSALLAAGLVVAMAGVARAQYPRRGGAADQPDWWVGVSYGFMQPGTVNDGGNSGTVWDFGYTSVTSAELAKSINGGSVGVLMNFATAPLTYVGSASSVTGSCATQCTAHADITQILLELRLGSGRSGLFSALGLGGLHSVYGLDVGATQYANFRDSVSTPLPPKSSSWDPTFGFHFGLGWRFSRELDSYAVEEYARVIHSQGSQVESSPPTIYTTRFGLRVGF